MAVMNKNGGRPLSTFSSNAGNRSDNNTSWSGMYAGGRGGVAGAPTGTNRWLPVLLAIFVLSTVLLGVFGVPAISYRQHSEGTFVNRMLMECNDALALTNGLSRSGGAESATILGRIRADVYAVDTINEVRNTVTGGGYFIDPQVFTDLYAVIDSYSNNLKLGNVVV